MFFRLYYVKIFGKKMLDDIKILCYIVFIFFILLVWYDVFF